MIALSLRFIGIVAILVWCGTSVATRLLQTRERLTIFALAATLGPALFIVLSNALGHLFPIRAAFAIVMVVLTALSAFLQWKPHAEQHDIPAPLHPLPARVLFVLLLVAGIAGLAYARDQGSDLWTPEYMGVPSQILAGNFPIREPLTPWEPIRYHYGPAFFSAGIAAVTGVSPMAATFPQPFIAAAGIVFAAAALAWTFSRSKKAAVIAGLLSLAGGGVFWLNGIFLLRDLWTHFFLHLPIIPATETAFRWLTPTIRSMHAQSLLAMLGHRPIALGAGFLFPFLLCLLEAWSASAARHVILWGITAVMLAAASALCFEASLVLILIGVVVFLIAAAIRLLPTLEPGSYWQSILCRSFVILLIITVVSLVQGGILSHLFKEGSNTASFGLGFDLRYHLSGGSTPDSITLWEWRFFRDYGPHVLLLSLATIALLRRRTTGALLLLAGLGWLHLLLPLFVHFLPRIHEMNRLVIMGFGLAAIPIAVFLAQTMLTHRHIWVRRITLLFVGGMLVAGTANATVRLFFPTLRLERRSFLPVLPSPSPPLQELYAWVKDHTEPSSVFYIPPPKNPALLFAYSTGRFFLGRSQALTDDSIVPLESIEEHCDEVPLRTLHVSYIATLSSAHADWFSSHCSQKNWTLAFSSSGDPTLRVYVLNTSRNE